MHSRCLMFCPWQKNREASGHYVARMEIGDTPGFRNLAIHELIEKYSSSAYRYSPSWGEKVLIDKVIQTQWPNALEDNVVIGPANFLITLPLQAKLRQGMLCYCRIQDLQAISLQQIPLV
jgi:hypothetical protein